MSRVNSERIKDWKNKDSDEKKKKHEYLLGKKQQWKEKVSSFWEDKIQRHYADHHYQTQEELRVAQQNQKIMEALEREEMQLIKRLQHSRNVAENAVKKLEEVQKQPARYNPNVDKSRRSGVYQSSNYPLGAVNDSMNRLN